MASFTRLEASSSSNGMRAALNQKEWLRGGKKHEKSIAQMPHREILNEFKCMEGTTYFPSQFHLAQVNIDSF